MPIEYKGKAYYTTKEVGESYPEKVQPQTVMRHAKKLNVTPIRLANRKNYFTEKQKDQLVAYNSPEGNS